MAQFRTTADILDLALRSAGEVTNGNSAYETEALDYLNRVHFNLISGGTIPLLKDATITVDEVWPWSRSRLPLVIELQPKFNTGSVTLTLGSEAGTFSSAPTVSVAGWHLHVIGRDEWFKISSHTANSTAFEIDGLYPDASGSGLVFEAVKLDYELTPPLITINSENNKFDFKKASGGSLITGTLTAGAYAPSDLATHVASVATAAAAGPTITGSYSAITKKFTFVSDGAGPSVFQLFFATGTNVEQSCHRLLGYDDVDSTGALTYTSTYILGGIARLVEPFKINKGSSIGSIFGLPSETFQRDYPYITVGEGYPTRFSVIREDSNGAVTVRFNMFPAYKTRVEIDFVPVPRDLKDSASSIPLVPRKHIDVLQDAAVFYLMFAKSDDRAQGYANLVQAKINAMIAQNRGSLLRSGDSFGSITPRRENRLSTRRHLKYGRQD